MAARGKDTTAATAGRQAEALAARFLEARGLTVVARNFRVRGGEVDLICRHGPTTVFVEVRLRRHPGFGGAGASITAEKRRRVILAARHWLAGRPPADCRFDCVLLSALEPPAIEWIRDAFSVD